MSAKGWAKRKSGSEYAGVSIRTFDSWLRNGMRHVKIRGTVLVRFSWIDSFLKSFEVDTNRDQRQVTDIVDQTIKNLI